MVPGEMPLPRGCQNWLFEGCQNWCLRDARTGSDELKLDWRIQMP